MALRVRINPEIKNQGIPVSLFVTGEAEMEWYAGPKDNRPWWQRILAFFSSWADNRWPLLMDMRQWRFCSGCWSWSNQYDECPWCKQTMSYVKCSSCRIVLGPDNLLQVGPDHRYSPDRTEVRQAHLMCGACGQDRLSSGNSVGRWVHDYIQDEDPQTYCLAWRRSGDGRIE